jgi:S-formylglutathione hydrolase FrmB
MSRFIFHNSRSRRRAIKSAIAFWCLLTSNSIFGQETIVMDSRHYSNVLGEIRNYRIYLPAEYYDEPEKKYPVVYYYHGWSQRYFGTINGKAENSTDLSVEENFALMASKYKVIVVKPDGYNADPEDPYNLRPYNIGPVETHRQFPLYFPELVQYIDATYRTKAVREQRAISGLSMGGFMSFWIAGKYPHLLSAAGSFCGSAEFVVGPRDFPVEYYHGYMYKNYEGLKLRLNYGDEDFIRAYHRDINRTWIPVMDNYETQVYPGAHDVVGLDDMFRFFVDVFNNPQDAPRQWSHIEVYPEFSVWDYTVRSDRNIPGFTVLENVDKNGFRLSVRKKLPEGESLPMINLSVLTAPIYKKQTAYMIQTLDLLTGKERHETIKSDHNGRLTIYLNGGLQEIGINELDQGRPNLVASVKLGSQSYPSTGKDISLQVNLLNKGGRLAEDVTAKLVQANNASEVEIKSDSLSFGDIEVAENKSSASLFIFFVRDSSLVHKFILELRDREGNQWQQSLVLELKPKGNKVENFEIADGRTLTFLKGGADTVTTELGIGNGDGIANPGESIVVLIKDAGLLRLTSLQSNHPALDLTSSYTIVSDSWTDFDHVGASFKYSMPLISSDFTSDGEVELYAEYWLPDYPDHHIKGGRVNLKIEGKDETPPQLDFTQIRGNNIFQAKFHDGGEIVHAEVVIQYKDNLENTYVFEMNDGGLTGDRTAGDGVYSHNIKVPAFGVYEAQVKVMDSLGNKAEFAVPDINLHEIPLYHD